MSRCFDPEDLAAWCDFYETDQRCGPLSLEDFDRMLSSHGVPDVGNPWPADDERHYRTHEGGFLSGEVEAVLSSPSREESVDEWAKRAEAAKDRIGLVLARGGTLHSAVSHFIAEEVWHACVLAMESSGWLRLCGEFDKALSNGLKLGVLRGSDSGLLVFRQASPQDWAELAPSRVGPEALSSEAPVPAVADWRRRRAACWMEGRGEGNG